MNEEVQPSPLGDVNATPAAPAKLESIGTVVDGITPTAAYELTNVNEKPAKPAKVDDLGNLSGPKAATEKPSDLGSVNPGSGGRPKIDSIGNVNKKG